MLFVVPEVPDNPSRKPLLQGFGCRLRADTLSCEALYVDRHIPAQPLRGELHERGRPPVPVTIEWEPLDPALWGNARIPIAKEESRG